MCEKHQPVWLIRALLQLYNCSQINVEHYLRALSQSGPCKWNWVHLVLFLTGQLLLIQVFPAWVFQMNDELGSLRLSFALCKRQLGVCVGGMWFVHHVLMPNPRQDRTDKHPVSVHHQATKEDDVHGKQSATQSCCLLLFICVHRRAVAELKTYDLLNPAN